MVKKGGCKMGKQVKAYKVDNLSKIDTTRYVEGNLFLTDRSVGILLNGKIRPFFSTPNMRNYVKKNDVQKMIEEYLNKEGESNG